MTAPQAARIIAAEALTMASARNVTLTVQVVRAEVMKAVVADVGVAVAAVLATTAIAVLL